MILAHNVDRVDLTGPLRLSDLLFGFKDRSKLVDLSDESVTGEVCVGLDSVSMARTGVQVSWTSLVEMA